MELPQVSGDRAGGSSKGTVSLSVLMELCQLLMGLWLSISLVLPFWDQISHHTDQSQEVQGTGRSSRSRAGCLLDRVF